jgi:hypothetical protein
LATFEKTKSPAATVCMLGLSAVAGRDILTRRQRLPTTIHIDTLMRINSIAIIAILLYSFIAM